MRILARTTPAFYGFPSPRRHPQKIYCVEADLPENAGFRGNTRRRGSTSEGSSRTSPVGSRYSKGQPMQPDCTATAVLKMSQNIPSSLQHSY